MISTAIDRYVRIMATTGFQRRYRLKHLEWEEVDDPGDVRHPILARPSSITGRGDRSSWRRSPTRPGHRARLRRGVRRLRDRGPERAGRAHAGAESELAESACHLEIERLDRSIGKQDQYAAASAVRRAYTFNPDDTVDVRALDLPPEIRRALRDEFLMFFTGQERSASDILGGGAERGRSTGSASWLTRPAPHWRPATSRPVPS